MAALHRGPFAVPVSAAILLAAAWFAFSRGGDDAPAPIAAALRRAEQSPPPIAANAAPEPNRDAAPPVERPAPKPTATLRGRCVDAQGAPLAGCTIRLGGHEGDRQRLDPWVEEHAAKPEWQDPPAITTGEDGRFEFTFWPPPPFWFSLDVAHAGSGDLQGSWHELAEGSETDLGDVTLQPGVTVTGMVVDVTGTPQCNVQVVLSQFPDRTRTARIGARWGGSVTTDRSGAFSLRPRLLPGEYRIETRNAELESPQTVTLNSTRPAQQIAVVVRQRNCPIVRGRVLDETGAPVASLRLEDRSAQRAAPATFTLSDGTFELVASVAEAPWTAVIEPVSDEYESDPSTRREVPWGSTDVELRVRRTQGLTVRVTDAGGTPVETYVVRVLPRHRFGSSSNDSRVRASGRHERGIAAVPSLTPGDWLLLVEFAAASGLEPVRLPFHHESGAQRLDVRVARTARRTVRVVAMDGAPIAGTTVQLCDPFDAPFDESRHVLHRDRWLLNPNGDHALVLAEGTTGRDGRVELRGPAGQELAVHVPGPGNVPQRQSGLRLEEPGEFVVPVQRGARLVGRVVPEETVAELKRLAGVGPREDFPAGRQPRIVLYGAQGRFPRDYLAGLDLVSLCIGSDGAFDIPGLPPGSWRLTIEYQAVHPGGCQELNFSCGEVQLFDSVPTQRDLELADLLPGVLEGLVLWNGQPLANSNIGLLTPRRQDGVATDANGRFRRFLRPDDYEVHVTRRLPTGSWANLPCATLAHVVRGQTTQQTFAVSSATLRVRVLDPEGKPVANLKLQAREEGGRTHDLPATGPDGTTVAEFAPSVMTLRVWPGARRRGERGPAAQDWMTLQTIGLAGGQENVVEVHLPAGAGY